MSRVLWLLSVLAVVFLATGFAVANAGERVTISLGLLTLYRVPVALVAFCGLFVGMLLMFATGLHSDLKVRKILRDRLADEARREQIWIDRNQQDLFREGSGTGSGGGDADATPPSGPHLPAAEDTEGIPE